LAVLLSVSPGAPAAAGQVKAHWIESNDEPEQLWYGFETLSGSHGLGGKSCWNAIFDIDGDGVDEAVCAFTEAIGSGFSSKIILYRSPLSGDALCQTYGPNSSYIMHSSQLIDVIGDGRPEIVLTKLTGDTVFIEIVGLTESCFSGWTVIPAAIGDHSLVAKGWDAIHVQALGGVDLNGDGSRELLFSRSAKPDSAFERGIVAWDIPGDRELWHFKLADVVGPNCFHVLDDGTQPYFAFATASCANAYSTNGMTSHNSYVLAIDSRGRERWRHKIGEEFFYGHTVLLDVDDDGRQELLCIWDGRLLGDKAPPELRCLDPVDGRILVSRPLDCQARGCFIRMIPQSDQGGKQVVVCAPDDRGNKLFFFDSHLNLTDTVTGDLTDIPITGDFVGDSGLELLAATKRGEYLLMDRGFTPLALTEHRIRPSVYRGAQGTGVFCDLDIHGWVILMPFERSKVAVLFARYRWWLAIAIGSLAALGLYRGIAWINELRWAAAGRTTLDRLGAMILVLDHQSRVVFANDNPLRGRLLGSDRVRGRRLGETRLAGIPTVMEAIEAARRDPQYPSQHRFEAGGGDGSDLLEVTTYPRLNHGGQVDGVIVMIEDAADRALWERKAVLGEAAQRWIHKLKGSMATARITLDNMAEDPRLSNSGVPPELLTTYLSRLREQIDQTAETATKILAFGRIPKPDMGVCDIGVVVRDTLQRYEVQMPPNVTLSGKYETNLPTVMADARQITEVLENLLSNAMQAIRHGGEIKVTVRMARELPESAAQPTLEIEVADSGCGISADDLKRVFEPGFTRSKSGTGIGLAVAREIARNHGGEIDAESEPGRGSVFTLRLLVGTGGRSAG